MKCRPSVSLALILLIPSISCSLPLTAQTLARPGWVGSGITVQSWFRHAVLYRIDTRSFARGAQESASSSGTLQGITERLDYIHNLGIDAILLEPLSSAHATQPIDAALGSMDDFDDLTQQASKRGLRILLTLSNADPAVARFWLTRGVAGFYVPGLANTPAIQAVRKLLPGFVGQRILMTDADAAQSPAAAKPPANELQLDAAMLKLPHPPLTNTASELRAALEQSQAQLRSGNPALATDAASVPRSVNRFAPNGHEADAAKLLAAVLLLSRTVPVLYAGQELGLSSPGGDAVMIPWGKAPAAPVEPEAEAVAAPPPPPPPPPTAAATFSAPERYVPYVPPSKAVKAAKPAPPDPASVAGQDLDEGSVLNFYRQLIQLHHGKAAVRDGDEMLLNHDNVNALVWVRKPANPSLLTPAVVVICNPSSSPLQLSIKSELNAIQLRGSFLRTLLRTDSEKLTMGLDSVALQPFGVYVGELRY